MDRTSKEEIKEFVYLYQVTRKITSLAREFLYILEDIKEDYNISDEKFVRCRKRVLDFSNDAIRDIESAAKEIQINFNK